MFFTWTAGLTAGFGTYMIATIIVGIAYLFLTTSLAEMASALPFSGGSYGFARATMGKMAGMLVGLAEASEYILTTAVEMMSLAQLCTQLFGTDPMVEPIWVAVMYFITVAIHVYGGRTYWTITAAMAILSMVLLIMYWFASLKLVNFSAYASNASGANGWFIGGGKGFMSVLPLAIWWYLGV
jgi:ethanolamine permease